MRWLVVSIGLLALGGCKAKDEGDLRAGCIDAIDNDEDGTIDCADASCADDDACADTDDTDVSTAVCTEPVDPACVDEMIEELSLHDDKVSDGDVTTTVDGEDFVTVVDATAGGSSQASQHPWVYVKFSADGAERVDIDDETALEDMTWDLALRRFILRLNSGDSGPSCVGAAESDDDYADIDSVPDGTEFALEDFYDDECTLQEDASGLPGSPAVALGDWWTYNDQCVATTLKPFLVQQADGSVIALVVEAYYESGQDTCNADGTAGSNSGIIQLRWRYVD
jgi:hypothetical protein